jgi:hypothetical protein
MVHPNFLLHYPRLIKNNYETWCIRVKTSLSSQDVWETIEKGFEEPIDERPCKRHRRRINKH